MLVWCSIIGVLMIIVLQYKMDIFQLLNPKAGASRLVVGKLTIDDDASDLLETCTRQVNDSHEPNRRNGVWYMTLGWSTSNGSIEIEISSFGAYLDTRDDDNVSVRILGVSNAIPSPPVFCQLWYDGPESAVVGVAVVEDTGRGMTLNGTHYQERLYSCLLPKTVVVLPVAVSLSFEICDARQAKMPIVLEERTGRRHEIGVCTAVTYGSIDPVKLVEWIEFNRLLGVTEFNFYASRIDNRTESVLGHYRMLGLVRLRYVAPPVLRFCLWCLKLATIAVLNDCMYRNMYRYKHMAVIDIDEIIVPKRHDTLNALLTHLDGRYLGPSYIFINAYFFEELPSVAPRNKSDATTHLTSIVKLNRLKASEIGYASKSIVKPRLCVVVQNHHCMRRSATVSKRWWTISVAEDLALLHHYKRCHFKKFECKNLLSNYYLDDSTVRFEKTLAAQVERSLKRVFD